MNKCPYCGYKDNKHYLDCPWMQGFNEEAWKRFMDNNADPGYPRGK